MKTNVNRLRRNKLFNVKLLGQKFTTTQVLIHVCLESHFHNETHWTNGLRRKAENVFSSSASVRLFAV